MYERDTLLQRRTVHYTEHTEVIEKLRNIENTNFELKLRSQAMKRRLDKLLGGLLFGGGGRQQGGIKNNRISNGMKKRKTINNNNMVL